MRLELWRWKSRCVSEQDKIIAEQTTKVEIIEDVLSKLTDIHNSYVALIKKISALQLETTEKGLEDIGDKLGKPFADVSEAAQLVEHLIHDTEIERNRLRNESA